MSTSEAIQLCLQVWGIQISFDIGKLPNADWDSLDDCKQKLPSIEHDSKNCYECLHGKYNNPNLVRSETQDSLFLPVTLELTLHVYPSARSSICSSTLCMVLAGQHC